MKKYAVIVAGGAGQRMGSIIPKQFLLMCGKPVVQYTIQAFVNAFADIEIVLVLPYAYIDEGKEIAHKMGLKNIIHFAKGGASRFDSVKEGLSFVSQPSIVFVHDAVRCLVSADLIQRCYEQAVNTGSAIPAVAATDSVRIENDREHKPVERNLVKIVQTPQTFQSEMLLSAFQQDYQPSFTDEATVVEASGHKVFLIEGDYNNLKITRPMDLYIAEKLLEKSTV